MALMMLSTFACNAQIKNEKTETVKIYGNCGMCKSTIEKAGNVKNVSQVVWNKDTKMATLTYDSLKTSSAEILKRIALSGYDNESFIAPDDTYANLPGCCHYDRPKKEMSNMSKTENSTDKMKMSEAMDHSDHSNHSENSNQTDNKNQMTTTKDSNPLSKVYESYFNLKNALVNSNGASASTNAKSLLDEINAVKMENMEMDVHMAWMKILTSIKEDTEHIADTKDVSHQRDHFMSLSKNLYEVMKLSKQQSPTYYQFCPMANDGKGANWLSKDSEIKNPYYGSQMLSCGKTVETLK